MTKAAAQAINVSTDEPKITKSTVEVLRNEFTRIRTKYGKLTPEFIVKEAAKKTNPLHKFFTWNDAEAAHKQRLTEAMQLVHRVQLTVQVSGESHKIREFVHVTKNDSREYVPIAEISVEPVLREQVIERAKAEIDGWTKRYEGYESYFQSAFAMIKAARKKFPKTKKRS